jgi:outer membrane protein OmpA-like peptidoglycan-associated protein
MNCSRASIVAALISAACLAVPSISFAQDEGSEATESSAEETEATDEASAEEEAEAEDEEAEGEGDEEDDAKESAHGSYEWKPSYGGGLEAGIFFSQLDRWNTYILEENVEPRLDLSSLWYIDIAAEASVLEGTRFSIFGGMQRPFSSNHTLSALYVGFEPAFAFRRDFWELALGIGAGLGSANLETESGGTMSAGLVVLRPFLEVRRYLGEFAAVYGRFGFHQWLVNNPTFENLDFTVPENNLDEGGPYFALGVRFGHYPEHVKEIGDTDGDGLRDDVDECPEEAEDEDGFEDDDGCPELDNDEDGIPDEQDKCPMRPEDKDGWQDDDGCPETDDDTDGDGILNPDDQCPEDPEDEDGFEDEDGCPDLDNDNDGIPDKTDKCPMEPGVKVKQGCPFELVQVTLDKIVIKDKIFFEYDKAVIKEESYGLLDQVAQTINSFDRIKKIEIQGHTDHAGSEDYNQKLSESRAQSVYDHLIEKGNVDAERLTYKGYGESKPLIPLGEDGKETDEEAAKNRRVEFVILEQETVQKTIREDKVKELKDTSPDAIKKIPTKKPEEGEESEKPEESDDSSEKPEESGDDEDSGDDEESGNDGSE